MGTLASLGGEAVEFTFSFSTPSRLALIRPDEKKLRT